MEFPLTEFANINQSIGFNLTLYNIQDLLGFLDLQQFLDDDLPIFSILVTLCVFGIVGNSHAFIVFRRYPVSTVATFMNWMVFLDLGTCVVCIPLELVQIRYTLTYPSTSLCKITRFLTYFTTLNSGFLLLVVALERRQKLCSPFQRQLSLKKSKKLGFVLTFLSLMASTPAAVFYDVMDRKTKVRGLFGKDCRDPKGHLEAHIYAIVFFVVTLIAYLICSVAYIQIGIVIRSQFNRERKRLEFIRLSRLPVEFKTPSRINRRKECSKRYKQSRDLTIMFIISSAVSFFGYILHFSSIIMRTTMNPEILREIHPFYSVLVRGYFLHNSIHPIVYFIVDRKFRTECKRIHHRLYYRLMCRDNKSKDGM